ncbi:MAG: DNA polymerase III subunit beta [Clostridia bacterium]
MKVICHGLDLTDAISKVIKALPIKKTIPVLEGIKVSAFGSVLTLSATDTELTIEKKINAEILVEGEIIVPGKLFTEFIRKLSNEQIELNNNDNDNMLNIIYGENETNFQLYNIDEYPIIKDVDYDYSLTMREVEFKEIINQTIFSASSDDSRPILKGCLIEINKDVIKSVAIDGCRLALSKVKLYKEFSNKKIIVPSRDLSEISKLLEEDDKIFTLYISDKKIKIDLGDTIVISSLLLGDFVKYEALISNDFATEIIINKAQFEEKVERVCIISRYDKNNLIKMNIKENTILLTSNSEISNIKENISASVKGKDLIIGMNAKYIADCLKAINTEYIKMSFNSSISPVIITPDEGESFLYMVLPIRALS